MSLRIFFSWISLLLRNNFILGIVSFSSVLLEEGKKKVCKIICQISPWTQKSEISMSWVIQWGRIVQYKRDKINEITKNRTKGRAFTIWGPWNYQRLCWRSHRASTSRSVRSNLKQWTQKLWIFVSSNRWGSNSSSDSQHINSKRRDQREKMKKK